MKQRQAFIVGIALLGFWLWRQRQKSLGPGAAEKPLVVNAAPNVINEDDTGEAFERLLKDFTKEGIIGGNKVFGFNAELKDGTTLSISSRPIVATRPGPGGIRLPFDP